VDRISVVIGARLSDTQALPLLGRTTFVQSVYSQCLRFTGKENYKGGPFLDPVKTLKRSFRGVEIHAGVVLSKRRFKACRPWGTEHKLGETIKGNTILRGKRGRRFSGKKREKLAPPRTRPEILTSEVSKGSSSGGAEVNQLSDSLRGGEN